MPRPRRLQYPGAYHHVMNKGAAGQNVFLDRLDRRRFLSLLGEAVDKCGIEVHAYCLMGNHYHLLMRTPEPNLDRAIHRLASSYVRWFNQRHGRDGPLFRARYRSLLVESDSYLLAVTRYIARNPISLGVTDLAGYEWSSHGAILGRRTPPQWLTISNTVNLVGSRRGYELFVDGPFGDVVAETLARKQLPTAYGADEAGLGHLSRRGGGGR